MVTKHYLKRLSAMSVLNSRYNELEAVLLSQCTIKVVSKSLESIRQHFAFFDFQRWRIFSSSKMASKKFLVVFGATGNQGVSVIKAIIGDPAVKAQFEIRGVTRDRSKPAAAALAEKGVHLVKVSSVIIEIRVFVTKFLS